MSAVCLLLAYLYYHYCIKSINNVLNKQLTADQVRALDSLFF